MREGIEELYQAYVAAGLTADDWTSGRYTRLATINSLRAGGVVDDALRVHPLKQA